MESELKTIKQLEKEIEELDKEEAELFQDDLDNLIVLQATLTQTKEKRALVLARNRAAAQLKRKALSPKERREFREISKQKI